MIQHLTFSILLLDRVKCVCSEVQRGVKVFFPLYGSIPRELYNNWHIPSPRCKLFCSNLNPWTGMHPVGRCARLNGLHRQLIDANVECQLITNVYPALARNYSVQSGGQPLGVPFVVKFYNYTINSYLAIRWNGSSKFTKYRYTRLTLWFYNYRFNKLCFCQIQKITFDQLKLIDSCMWIIDLFEQQKPCQLYLSCKSFIDGDSIMQVCDRRYQWKDEVITVVLCNIFNAYIYFIELDRFHTFLMGQRAYCIRMDNQHYLV